MSVLSDRTLRTLIADQALIQGISDLDEQVQPCSVDLRLDGSFAYFDRTKAPPAAEFAAGQSIQFVFDPVVENAEDLMTRIETEALIMQPGDFFLGSTVERVNVPSWLVSRVDGRSSVGRLGVFVHVTAGLIDPGFSGRITLELFNANPFPVVLHPGMRICQIEFEFLDFPCQRPYGTHRASKYQDQNEVTVSRLRRDFQQGDRG